MGGDEAKKSFINKVKNFDTITNPPTDHHYIKNKGTTLSQKILTEWKILSTSLPDSIFVGTYETRIDLMRAAIIGPQDTPYSDGLFFFDILFPSSYPAQPPKVFYHSHGLDLNPNLYPSGEVCLSLLNTWGGCENERWNPKQSTMLQVLVSIQGLVLNAQPYYNEPARWHFFEEGRASKYTEDVFMDTCMAMVYTIRQPPMQFKEFVAVHFRRQAHPILLNFRERMKNMKNTVSMCKLFLKLAKAFEGNGACCDQLLVDEVKKEEEALREKSENNDGFVVKVWNKLKNLLDYFVYEGGESTELIDCALI
ncbi:hypothetical protein L1049_003787 [Liquidambar formosana]|uniref:UBC core domain-containing protein n=1 Tax=Liquidambar formosana TaxID=63359 RepID=A0AAP0RM88_LIQFO